MFLQIACISIVLFSFGLILTYLGYRFFIHLLPVWYLLFGFGLSAGLASFLLGKNYLTNTPIWLFLGGFVGLILTVISNRSYIIGVFIFAGSIGYTFGAGLLNFVFNVSGFGVVIAGIISAGLLVSVIWSLKLRKWVIVILTSAGGANAILFSLMLIINLLALMELDNKIIQLALNNTILFLVTWLILFGTGLYVQFVSTKKYSVLPRSSWFLDSNQENHEFPIVLVRLLIGSVLTLVISVGIVLWLSRASLVNFIETNGPSYTGDYGPLAKPYLGQLKIVSWNIQFGEKIAVAVKELRNTEELRDADIILLQEVDEWGVEQIAQELAYYYVYFPASIHRHGRLFGNAVLSKWPIEESVKIVLPYENPSNQQIRIAAGAILVINDTRITAYSVHTETPVLSSSKRSDQVEYLLQESVPVGAECVIVGGDFNTISTHDIQTLNEHMEILGLFPVSKQLLPTINKLFLDFTLDHIFAKGFSSQSASVWPETEASDHYPIWAVVNGCVQN